ncbi:MAG TPA: glycosyltransferase family 25 protein [Acetivibrio sp.]|nr:glycosyltransferase family 25 protein [Acetivibrio sp.]
MNFESLDCILINLDRSPERLTRMQERLNRINLPFRKVSAVDGKELVLTKEMINAAEYERCHGKYVVPTEVGCYLSHYRALQSFLESGKEFGLILEDDMEFCDDFMMVLEELIRNHQDWDVVKMDGYNDKFLSVTRKVLYKDYRMVLALAHQPKSGSYLINRYAARKYVDGLLPMTVPYDHEFTKWWKYDIRLFTVVPFPNYEEQGPSTIDYKMAKRNKKPWYKKFNTYAYRLGIAWKRLWYGLKVCYFSKGKERENQ